MGCCTTPTSPRSPSLVRPRSRSTSTRPATANGKRVQALGGAKNHMLVLPDADLDLVADSAVNARLRFGGRALHGDLGRRGASSPSPTSSSRRSPSGCRASRSGDGTARLRHGSAHHEGAPRPGRRATSTIAVQDGVDRGGRRSRREGGRRRERLLARPDPHRQRRAPAPTCTSTRSSDRCCRSCA